MLLARVVETPQRIAETSRRLEKVELLAALPKQLAGEESEIAVAFLRGYTRANGRRQGWLSNLHLGARDTEKGGYAMLGKTFKGLTDEMLTWQTEQFLKLEIGRDSYTVYVEPKIVAEIAFSDIQVSTRYPSGMALRFARVKRYRPDKTAAEADTVETVRKLAG